MINHHHHRWIDRRSSVIGRSRSSIIDIYFRSPVLNDRYSPLINRSAIIDHLLPSAIDHRSSSLVIGKHMLSCLAGDNMEQPKLTRGGPTAPSSPRRVGQYVARTEQPLEHAAGFRAKRHTRELFAWFECEIPTQSPASPPRAGLVRFEGVLIALSMLVEQTAQPPNRYLAMASSHSSCVVARP